MSTDAALETTHPVEWEHYLHTITAAAAGVKYVLNMHLAQCQSPSSRLIERLRAELATRPDTDTEGALNLLEILPPHYTEALVTEVVDACLAQRYFGRALTLLGRIPHATARRLVPPAVHETLQNPVDEFVVQDMATLARYLGFYGLAHHLDPQTERDPDRLSDSESDPHTDNQPDPAQPTPHLCDAPATENHREEQ